MTPDFVKALDAQVETLKRINAEKEREILQLRTLIDTMMKKRTPLCDLAAKHSELM